MKTGFSIYRPVDEDLALIYISNNPQEPQEILIREKKSPNLNILGYENLFILMCNPRRRDRRKDNAAQDWAPAFWTSWLSRNPPPLPRFLPATPFDVYYTKLNSPYPKHSSLT